MPARPRRKTCRLDTGSGYLTRSDSRAQVPHRPDVPPESLNRLQHVRECFVRSRPAGRTLRDASKEANRGEAIADHISSGLGKRSRDGSQFDVFRPCARMVTVSPSSRKVALLAADRRPARRRPRSAPGTSRPAPRSGPGDGAGGEEVTGAQRRAVDGQVGQLLGRRPVHGGERRLADPVAVPLAPPGAGPAQVRRSSRR